MPTSVLIVDDDPTIVEFLATVFTDDGYDARRADDGFGTLRNALRDPPDLVLSDIAMPGLDGIALTRRLRKHGIPVILLSASIPDPGIPDVPYLPKPCDLDQVLALATQALGRDAAHRWTRDGVAAATRARRR